MKRLIAIILATITCFGLCTSVQAADVTLSLYSSDETPAAWLDAAVDFTVDGSMLTIDVENMTGGSDPAYDICQLYFNVKDNVTGLTPDDIWGWELNEWDIDDSSNPTKADGFGIFDYSMIVGNNDPNIIGSGDSKTFTLLISGTGVTEYDFYTELSAPPPSDYLSTVAAKFVHGPGDDSAFGGVPEPTTIALLGLGSLSLIRRKRR